MTRKKFMQVWAAVYGVPECDMRRRMQEGFARIGKGQLGVLGTHRPLAVLMIVFFCCTEVVYNDLGKTFADECSNMMAMSGPKSGVKLMHKRRGQL